MTMPMQMAGQGAAGTVKRAGKYLTLQIAAEEYGIEILHVQEIIGIMPVTHVPRTPDYVRGVINLRGRVIPVVDLRLKFGMESIEDSEKTCIIVVEIQAPAGKVTMGFVVDEVLEVTAIAEQDIEDAPSFGTGLDTGYILGMAKIAGSVKILLDIGRVLKTDELIMLDKVA